MNQGNSNIDVVNDVGSAATLLNPLRMQILKHLEEPNSASGLSRILNIPRQKLNYHLRELEKKNLVEFVKETKRGNCTERIMKATAKSYLINVDAVRSSPEDLEAMKDQFSSNYLVAAAANMINEVSTLKTGAAKAKKKLPTYTLQTEIRFETVKDLNGFAEELSQAIAKLTAKYHKEDSATGRTFKLCTCSYPALTKKSEHQPKTSKDE
ncbi:MAG: helix-turn-helix domain-containing protein [Bacteroidota bacterium]